MTSTSSATHELALRLIALEASRAASQSAGPSDVERVLERMRLTLSRFAGVAGYRTVILRAVALGKVKTPSLKNLNVRPDGSLQSFAEVEEQDSNAGTTVLVHLLDLLIIFIGRPLTISLVLDAWPDARLEEKDFRAGEQL